MKIITIIGARPQFIKAAMLSRAIIAHNRQGNSIEIEEKILHTGQHYDYEMSEIFFRQLGMAQPTWHLGCTGSAPDMKEKIVPILQQEQPDWVVVYGDTTSTAAGAMAAHEAGCKLAHVEAGLRSFNPTMAEEQNRILTDGLATILFCPTHTAVENLRKEGIEQGVKYVGDIMYDAAVAFGENEEDILDTLQVTNPYILLTVHRAENTDSFGKMVAIITALQQIEDLIVWPMHPRTRKMIESHPELEQMLTNVPNLKIILGQGYAQMATLERHAKLIMTDSGGVQKEAYFHRVPCITLRDETEWTETVKTGWNCLAGTQTECIVEAVRKASCPTTQIDEYGDGHTAEKIVNCLCAY